jgi:hypothetical protein
MCSLDRCDFAACDAQALVRAEFITGPLFFCGHHWREVADAAAPAALYVIDEQDNPADSNLLQVA